MAKVYKVMDPHKSVTSDTQCPQTNWGKCILCQKDSSEILRCPAKDKRGLEGDGYKTITSNLLGFEKIGCLHTKLLLTRLNDGDGIEKTLQNHGAKWHDSCRLKYNKTELHRAEKRKTPREENTDAVSTKFTRRSMEHPIFSEAQCFFCDKPAGGVLLHDVSTFGLDERVRKCALKLEDMPLLAKLSAGDLIAQEAKYHTQCLVSLYNKARGVKLSEETDTDIDRVNHGIALAELVCYIDETRADSDVAPLFKMTDLTNLYSNRLQQLGTNIRVHSTKLKNRILGYFPDMEAHKQGREIVLVFNKDIGHALRKACEQDADDDAVHLARAATILRRDMFKMKAVFSDSFPSKCLERSVPTSLLALVGMIMNGPSITERSNSESLPAAQLSISHLLMYNSAVRRRKETAATARHSKLRETPLPVYLGVMLHTKTRKRELVDSLFNLGLCISYDRVLSISTDLGNKLCHHYEVEKAVCPPNLRSSLFTTAAADNIDHNPSSTSAHDSFHGTGISLFQHQSSDSRGVQRVVLAENHDVSRKRTLSKLPESYTTVPPLALGKRDVPVPLLDGPNTADGQLLHHAQQKECR